MKKQKKNTLKYLLIGLGVFLLFIIIARKSGWVGGEDLIEVYTDVVEKRTLVETVSANGKVQPEIEVKISPDVSGEIIDIFVKEGDKVKKGDILVKINPDIYISNLDRIAASLNQQKANLANAKARLAQVEAQFITADLNYKRNKSLKAQGVISEAEYENIYAQYLVAKAEVDAAKQTIIGAEYSVKSAEAALSEARDNLTKTSIFAPVDGTVSRLNHEKGERVAGASQFSPGTEIIRIADLNRMEVKVDVNENDIIRVNLGDTAEIEIDAYLNQKFTGIVTSIANSANVTGLSIDQVTNFEVKIAILPSSYEHLLENMTSGFYPFRPGMSASVNIMTTKVYNVLSVPIQAVTTRDNLNNKKNNDTIKSQENTEDILEVVFVYANNEVTMQHIKSGIQDNTHIQIIEGLSEGQEVVSGPYRAVSRRLKDNDKVKKVDRDKITLE